MNPSRPQALLPGRSAAIARAAGSRSGSALGLRGRWEHLAAIVWIGILTAIAIRILVWPRWNSVYPIFGQAGRHWHAGAELYRIPDNPYRYSPLVAIGFVPLSFLPDRLAAIVWLMLNAAVYLAALAWWCGAALPRRLDTRAQAFLFLLVIPLSVGSLNNGQSNALLLGLILAAVTSACREHWVVAGACIAVATLLKIYPLVIGLLLAAVYGRKILAPLAVALVIGLGLPFCFQAAAYVWSQYAGWFGNLASENRQLAPVELWYRDLRLVCQLCHIPLGPSGYRVIELCAGVGIAAYCWFASRGIAASRTSMSGLAGHCPRRVTSEMGSSQQQLLVTLLALGCCWMTALGPATESCTYILLAPCLAWALVNSSTLKEPRHQRALLLLSCTIFLIAQVAVWFPGGFGRRVHSYGLQPAAALLFSLYVVLTAWRNPGMDESHEGPSRACTFQSAA
jgi:Glycosyltransferase family 87